MARHTYAHFLTIPTRWMDNDTYGHVNNVVYYAYFDTVINEYLIRVGGLDIARGDYIGVAVETGCKFMSSISFPEVIEAGLRVAKLGTSSVRYEVGLFPQGVSLPAAEGYFTHVFVDRQTRRSRPIPPDLRAALEKLLIP
jgi:acyl-CoA thioester hydrolase